MHHWRFRRLALLSAAAVLVATMLPAAREALAADACLDRGGVYDYAAAVCRTDVERLPYSPGPWLRAPNAGSLATAAVITAALALALAGRDLVRRSRPAS